MLVQRTERFDKSLDLLRRGDARAMLAARNAEAIIGALAADDLGTVLHKLTCHGEARLEKGVKFDLGSGYRLVSVRRRGGVLMLFAGSHDASDRWLERHRGALFARYACPGPVPAPRPPATLESVPADDDIGVLPWGTAADVTQRELRQIFRGLCGA
jgi:hypothetical protein